MFRVEDHHWWYAGLRAMLRQFWQRHVTAAGPRVLDAGCGTGANLLEAGRWATALGIDLSPDAVRFCRKRGLTRTAVGSTEQLPFPDDHFDVVLSMDVVQHQAIRDKMAPLYEIHRVLRPGGLLLINLPAYQWLHSSHDVAVHQDRRFTKRELLRMLRAAGFQPVRATYWNAFLFTPAAVVRLWRKLHPPEQSDLVKTPGPLVRALFRVLLAIERRLIRACPLPFGLSVFAAARKT